MSIHLWLALAVAVVALCYDVTQFRIPNWLAISAMLLGITYHSIMLGLAGTGSSLIGVAIGFFPMLLVYLCKGIGAGDVKLFAGLGALLHIEQIIMLMALSFIFAGVVSILFIAYQLILKLVKKSYYYTNSLLVEVAPSEKLMMFGLTKVHQFPFMLAVAPAMLAVWLLSS